MIYINLIPELPKKVSSQDIVKVLLVLTICSSLAYLGPYLYSQKLKEEVNAINNDISQMQAELTKLQVNLGKIRDVNQALDTIKGLERKILALSRGRKQPVLMFDKLQILHLEKMWLDTITLQSSRLQITGYASDHTIISEYVRRIKNVTGDEIESNFDMKNFQPKYLEAKEIQKKDEEQHVVYPIVFSNIEVKNISKEDKAKTNLQKFQIEFNVNLTPPEGI